MQRFEFHNTKYLILARGASNTELVEQVRALGCSAAFIVTDAGVLKAGLLEKTLRRFQADNLPFALFHEVQADPPEDVINTAVEAAREFEADCIIGFGGGSSMDVAKLVALLVLGKEKLPDIYGVNQVKGGRLPLILVPTTAGTGSEVTPISIVTTGVSEKKGVVSPVLLPDIAILDAELTLGLPANVTAATGIDAMVHAIEAYTSRRLKNPMSDCLAREALRLLGDSIHKVCRQGSDIEARENMLLGACMAGMAFANAPVGGVHALAYPVGARFHVPHGLSNSLVLAPVMRFNLSAAAPLYAELANILVPAAAGSQEQRANRFVKYLEFLPSELRLETRLRDVGITAQDIPQLADDAMKQTRLLMNNPRKITREDAVTIYSEAL